MNLEQLKTDDQFTVKDSNIIFSDIDEQLEFCRAVGQSFNYVSSRIFLTHPEDKNCFLKHFLDEYETELTNVFGLVERNNNYIGVSTMNGDCLFSNDRKEDCFVCQIGDNATFKIGHIGSVSFRLFGNHAIELSRLFINTDYRGQGMGKRIVNIAQQITKRMNVRLMCFPCPPLTEVDNQGWNRIKKRLEIEKLVLWYSKLGFVKCHPEFVEVIRVSGKKKMSLGIKGMMSYR